MKKNYLRFSGAIAILGIIIAFQNFLIEVPVVIFLDSTTSSLFWPLLLTLVIGFASGVLFGLYLKADEKKGASDFGDDIDI